MNDSTLLSIREFSKMAGIQQSALRYYDKIGLFAPAMRGENNYRYYTPMQLITLKFITVLADLGIPLSVIKDLGINRSPESIIDTLARQEMRLDRQMHQLRTAYSIIHTYRDNMQNGLLAIENEISVEELDEFYVIYGPENDFSNDDTFYKPFIDFCNSADSYKVNLHYPIGGYHNDMETFLKKAGQPNKFFSLDPFGNVKCPAGKYLIGYTRGYYGTFGDFPQRMAKYAEESGLAFSGAVHVLYLIDEISEVNPDKYLARIAVPVSNKKR